MTNFRIARHFDVIVCVFDSINHLLRFSEWKKTFRQVALHLDDNGLFIFDVNTIGKLRRLTQPRLGRESSDGTGSSSQLTAAGAGYLDGT